MILCTSHEQAIDANPFFEIQKLIGLCESLYLSHNLHIIRVEEKDNSIMNMYIYKIKHNFQEVGLMLVP